METMKAQNYELIIDKLRKILALRDAGNMGEARAAELALNRLCDKYGISIDEIIASGEEKKRVYFKGLSDNLVKNILFACYYKVTNQPRISFYTCGRGCIAIELTPLQEVELKELFIVMQKAYKKAMKQMISDFNEAFIIKNQLYSDSASESCDKPLSPEEMARIRRIFNISMAIKPTPIPRKMIETR